MLWCRHVIALHLIEEPRLEQVLKFFDQRQLIGTGMPEHFLYKGCIQICAHLHEPAYFCKYLHKLTCTTNEQIQSTMYIYTHGTLYTYRIADMVNLYILDPLNQKRSGFQTATCMSSCFFYTVRKVTLPRRR